MEIYDPICGMELTGFADIVESRQVGQKKLFCSGFCRDRFEKDPDKFFGRPLLELRQVKRVFNLGKVKVEALRGLSLRIWSGDFTAIIGSSGSGKSTALNIIGLLDAATEGEIILEGRDVNQLDDDEKSRLRSRTFGFVFQQYNLIPWLTAYDNVAMPSIFSHREIDRARIEKVFSDVGLYERMNHRPVELSGGEQQRVSLARALVADPEIILADEPTGNLDSSTGNKILGLLMDLKNTYHKTLVVVTHDKDIAGNADQVLAMRDGTLLRNHNVQMKKLTE